MNFFGIGLPEMILIMVVALLIFGPKKLPEIGRTVGKAIKGFQEASNDFQAEFKREAELLEQVKAIPNNIMNPINSSISAPLVSESVVAESIVMSDSEQLVSQAEPQTDQQAADQQVDIPQVEVELVSDDSEAPVTQQL